MHLSADFFLFVIQLFVLFMWVLVRHYEIINLLIYIFIYFITMLNIGIGDLLVISSSLHLP